MLDTSNDISTRNNEYMNMYADELQELTENLYAFYSIFVASRFEDDTEAPHIKALAKQLMDITDGTSDKKRLLCAMPPQHSKSSLVTLAYSVWLIINNPKLRILIVNAEKELSIEFGIAIRQLIQEMGSIYGITVSRVKSSATNLRFELFGRLQQGSIRLTGASGSITGHPTDIILVDDPYKGLIDELTPTALNKKWNWFTTLIEQRVRPSTKLIVLHTRWHSEDIQGRILDDEYQREKYEHVEYAAIDENGKPLWDYYGIDFYLDKQKTMGERQFQAIYQQKPIDLTSDFFHTDHLIFEDTFDDYAIGKCRSWDIASSDDTLGDQRDYTVGARMLKTPSDEYWIFDYERGQYGNDVKDLIRNTARLDGPEYNILLETGTRGGAAGLLYDEYKSYLTGYPTRQSEPIGTKADRATPLANAVYDGKIHILINNEVKRQTLLDEFRAFPNGKHDDIVDAISYGYLFLKEISGQRIATGGKRTRRRL